MTHGTGMWMPDWDLNGASQRCRSSMFLTSRTTLGTSQPALAASSISQSRPRARSLSGSTYTSALTSMPQWNGPSSAMSAMVSTSEARSSSSSDR